MLGRFVSPNYMAGVALAALAHTGLIAGVFMLEPAGGAGRHPADGVFIVTLVDDPVPDIPPERELMPEPAPAKPAAPEPVQEMPEPEPTPDHAADIGRGPSVETAPGVPEPVSSKASAESRYPSGETPDTPMDLLEERSVNEAAETSQAESMSAEPFSAEGNGKVDMDAYLRAVRLRLAEHAPKGVTGARNCEVEFQLSREGEVIYVGIRTSSGSRLFDRRCLNSVTSAVPFPAAPSGASAEDLSFSIVMKQKR